jgi:hypothetical protein
MYNNLLYSIVVFILILCSCNKKDPKTELNPGYEYFPLDTNSMHVYEIVRRSINLIEDITFTYYQKEQIASIYKEGDETVYVLEKYIKPKEADLWKEFPDTIETIRIADGKIIQTENNIRYLKLIFPVLEGRQWNGNIYNTLGNDIYTIKFLDKAFQLDNRSFDKTMTVEQASDTTDLTKRDVRFEVYAYNTGLIYKKNSRISLDFVTGDTLEGTILYQKYLYNAY